MVARTDKRQEGHEEVLVIIRFRDRENDKVHQTDYYLSNAASETALAEFARADKAERLTRARLLVSPERLRVTMPVEVGRMDYEDGPFFGFVEAKGHNTDD